MPSAMELGLPQYGSRQAKIVTIPGTRSETPGQRDNGKSFLMIEMAARPAEKWAARAFLALSHAHADIPPGIMASYGRAKGDMRQVAEMAGLIGHMRFPELDPLMDELMACVSWVVDPGPPPVTRSINDSGTGNDDIEEVVTRQRLRQEVVDLHVGFLLPAAILNLIAVGSTMTEISPQAISYNTRTSRRR